MSRSTVAYGTPVPFSSSTNVLASDGVLLGIFVSTSTSGTVTIYDSATTTTTTKLVDTTGTLSVGWYPIPITFTNGCYIVIGGTLKATAVVVP